MKTDDEPIPGGDLERTLLVAIWDHRGAACTARDLHDQVGAKRGIVYTTVAKVLDRMVEKGLLSRQRTGRAYVYRAQVSPERTQRSVIRRAFQGIVGRNPRPALAALVGALEDVSPDLLDELAAELEARREEKDDGT